MSDEKPPTIVCPSTSGRVHPSIGNGRTFRLWKLFDVRYLPSPDLRARLRYDLPLLEIDGESQ